MDRRTAGVAGAARTSPHSLLQELLNQSDDRLWGFVSNGKRLRILRNNISLTRQAFVEFDLEAMMDGEVYAGCPELGLPALGSFLWSDRAMPDLFPSPTGRGAGGEGSCRIANADFLEASRWDSRGCVTPRR